MGVIWENSLGVFIVMTCIIGGGAAMMTGRAMAITWRPLYVLIWYMVLLTCAVRFLHFALFEGTLLSFHFWLIDLVVLLISGLVGFRITRTNQMVTQYSWLYEKTGPFSWKEKTR